MNFPESQRVGSLAEQDVARLFTSWSWGYGIDRIDAGYDLSVEPDRQTFLGARFLVQVKGTGKAKKGTVVAQVSKSRLREYFENPHPVFIVRALPDGRLLWVHAQRWATENQKKLTGNGQCGVRFDPANSLADQNKFLRYLEEIMKPAATKQGGLIELGNRRSAYLKSLDDRFTVKVGLVDGAEQYEISAAKENVDASFEIRGNKENLEKIQDAIEFGLPTTAEVDVLKVSGSKIFEELGANRDSGGTVTIVSNDRRRGCVYLCPGESFSPFAETLAVPCQIFRGQKGAAISNCRDEAFVDLTIRLFKERPEVGRANVHIAVRPTVFDVPIREVSAIGHAVAWADQALAKNALLINCEFNGQRMPLHSTGETFGGMLNFLRFVRALGQLHQIARALYSDFSFPRDFTPSYKDVDDVDLLYGLLRGERRHIEFAQLGVEPESEDFPERGCYLVKADFSVTIGERAVGTIPVELELRGYEAKNDSTTGWAITRGEHGEAWISYRESQ